MAVNGRKWSASLLRDAIKVTGPHGRPLELLAENSEFFRTYSIHYIQGARYPALIREAGKEDMLSRIIQPLAAPARN